MKKKMEYLWILLGCAVLIICWLPQQALAFGNIKLGLLEIHPEFSVTGGIDDNVFLEHKDEKNDKFGIVSPGISFVMEKEERYYLGIGYLVDIIRFEDYDSQDYEDHKLSGVFNIDFPSGLFINLDNFYNDTSDYATSELTDRIEHKQNNGAVIVGLELNDNFKLQAEYISDYLEYDRSKYDYLNYVKHTFGPAVYWKFSPKTSALVEYHYGVVDYFDVDDGPIDKSSTFHEVMGGVTWKITGKSTGTLKGGYQWRNYDEEYTTSGAKRDDKNTWVASGEIDTKFTPKTSVYLLISRSIVESTFTNNDYYVENYGFFRITQELLYKLNLSLGMGYAQNSYRFRTIDYETGKKIRRKDKIFDAKVNLEYKIQEWLIAGGEYNHQARDSNSTIHDYDDNKASLYLKVMF